MLDPQLQQATSQLGRTLRACPPVKAYLEACARLRSDAGATALLDELAQHQATIRTKQSNLTLSRSDIDSLRDLQYRVQGHPAIAAYLQAQEDLRTLLPQLNLEISQLLGVDFAALGRKSGCC